MIMSQRSHSFRSLPPSAQHPVHSINTNPQPSAQPSPHTHSFIWKRLRRFIRDLRAKSRASTNSNRLIFISLFVACIIVVIVSLRSRHASQHPFFQQTTCACPVPPRPTSFTRNILSRSRFVARLRITHYTHPFSNARVIHLYRGPYRAAQFPLLIPSSITRICTLQQQQQQQQPASFDKSTSEWLVVAGAIQSCANHSVSHPSGQNCSILLPASFKPRACHIVAEPHPSDHAFANGMIWMTPWSTFPEELADFLMHDRAIGALWWRADESTFDFTDAVLRANNVMPHGNHPSILNAPHDIKSHVPYHDWWLKEGTTVIAACKDRTHTLLQALPTWLAANQVDEVVLVDWSSDPPILSSLAKLALNDARIVLVNAKAQSQWVLSKAYNLAARSAAFSRILKVDCDTMLAVDFLDAHPLPRNLFYAGDWRLIETGATNALHTNGLLYVYRDDFLAVGGFDERVTTYGWDDSDIAERLSMIRTHRAILSNKVTHIPHSASLRVLNQHRNSLLSPDNPFAASVEIQRNRLLLTKFNLPQWRASSTHTVWNVRHDNQKLPTEDLADGDGKPGLYVFVVEPANEVTAASALVSDTDAVDVAKRAIRLILHRLGEPLLPKTLTLDFYKNLIAKVAYPDKYAEIMLLLRGGCLSKLVAHVSAKTAADTNLTISESMQNTSGVAPPLPYIDWRLRELWLASDADCSCSFSSIFDATSEEIFHEVRDVPIDTESRQQVPDDERSSAVNILRSFSEKSELKTPSVKLAKWHHAPNSSKVLISDLYCGVDPTTLSVVNRQKMRQHFAALIPSVVVTHAVHKSLSDKALTMLDSPLFNIDKRSDLIPPEQSFRIKKSILSNEAQRMIARWTRSSSTTEAFFVHSLEARARSVMVAAYLADKGWDQGQLPASLAKILTDQVAEVSRTLSRWFTGCNAASPSTFFQSFPELALIAAGLMSGRWCS